jgi:hypothetical protein
VVVVRGKLTMETRISARPGYGLEIPQVSAVTGGVVLDSESLRLGLSATIDLDFADGDVTATFDLSAGESASFALEVLRV